MKNLQAFQFDVFFFVKTTNFTNIAMQYMCMLYKYVLASKKWHRKPGVDS